MNLIDRAREPRRVGDIVETIGAHPMMILDMGPADGGGPVKGAFFAGNESWTDDYAIDFAEQDPLLCAADPWSCWTEDL